MNISQQRPVARQEGLVIQEMPDEVLVFDTKTNQAHCLNATAAYVWKACDGSRSIAEIAKSFGDESGKSVSEDLVWLAIDQLNENNLLAKELKADFKGESRRSVIRKIGLAAAVALPIVSSLVAPSAVMAAACTGAPNGSACTNSAGATSVCCSGVCCNPAQNTCLGNNGTTCQ